MAEDTGTATPPAADQERERLEALSEEILQQDYPDAGDGGDPEANGQFGGGKPEDNATDPDATNAGEGKPDEGTQPEGGGDGQGTEKAPKWAKAMPESLRGRLADMTDEERAYLQGVAEDGLRQDEFSRLTGELPSKDDLAVLMQSHRALQAIKANPEGAIRFLTQGGGEGGGGEPGEGGGDESVDTLAASLMEKTDPAEFASTLKKILTMHGESVKEGLKSEAASTPTAKASRVNTAAKAVRQEKYPDLDDETWGKACAAFQKACEDRNADWRDVNPDHLDFLLEPYVQLAQSGTPAKPKPEDTQEPRAAALPPGQAGTGTKTLDPWDREGREATDDELFEKTLGKFGLTEQQLAGLRANG